MRHVFGQNACFAFCRVFRMSVTYKIGLNIFDVIFLRESPEKLSYFRCKLFSNEDNFQNICLNHEIWIILVYRSIFFFQKLATLNNSKMKRVSSQFLSLDIMFGIVYVNSINQLTQTRHSRAIEVQIQRKVDGLFMTFHIF